MKALLLGLGLLMANASYAGGIFFEPLYKGLHPLSGNAVKLSVTDGSIVDGEDKPAKLEIENSLGSATDLKLHFVSRNQFETVFELIGSNGVVAKVVTTGDCQVVERLFLVFPSGVSLPMSVAH